MPEEKYEGLIEGILSQKFGTTTGFFDASVIAGLRNNLLAKYEQGLMHPAGVGKHFTFQKNAQVRGDVIHWMDEKNPDEFEKAFFNQVEAFINYLNRTCYAGINGYEFHYALYHEGSFYKRHLDQFSNDRGRKFSMVTYLNAGWQKTDGGQLTLYLGDAEQEVLPEPGRVVFFKADEIEHEVKIATRDRMSIAGWLLSR